MFLVNMTAAIAALLLLAVELIGLGIANSDVSQKASSSVTSQEITKLAEEWRSAESVSYTHLDVYKRQSWGCIRRTR